MKIRMIFTGGTISMKHDATAGGAIPALTGEQILARIEDVRAQAEIDVFDFGAYPGPHITPSLMMDLARITQESVDREDVEGVIITHGTDTLEETAYFLDLVLDTVKPVILIGSMNHTDDPEWDGPINVRDSLSAVICGQFKGLGVLTCLHGEINAASEVTKTHTQQRDTFMSFDFGPVGRIFEGKPVFLRKPYIHDHVGFTRLVEPVHIMKCYAGISELPFRLCIEQGIKGLVVEAMGTGNVPPAAFDGIAEMIDSGIPVVLVSRCPRGATEDVYGYYGAGKNLRNRGVIFAQYLNGQKARIKLMLALGKYSSLEDLKRVFEGD